MVRYRVHACTDVTGFGLMGHGFEMAQGSDVALHIDVSAIDLIPEALEFARMGVLPAGMYRNRSFAEAGVDVDTTELAVQDQQFDPQPSGGLRQPGEAQDMMRAAMQEVIRLANLEGVPLPRDNDEQFLRTAMPTFNPDGMPSMRQDVLAKRPTEVEEFAGVVRARAKKYGMPTPANDFFYARIQEIEAGYCK